MFSRRSRIFGVVSVLCDSLPTAVAFLFAYWIRAWLGRANVLREIYPLEVYLPLLLAAVVVFPAVGYLVGAHHQLESRSRREMANDIFKIALLGSLILFAGLFLFKRVYVSRTFILIFSLVEFLFLGLGRWLFLFGNKEIETDDHCRQIVIVGTGKSAGGVASLLEQAQEYGLRLLCFVSISNSDVDQPEGLRGSYWILPIKRLTDLLHTHVVDEVVFTVESTEELRQVEPMMQVCEEEGVRMRVHLDFLPSGYSHVYVEQLAQVPLLTYASASPDEVSLLVKRVMDFLLAACFLVVLSPLMLLLAFLVSLTPGPILYRQTRCGLGGRRFTLLKFRSMVDHAEDSLVQFKDLNEVDSPVFKMRNDPRCTGVGKWMRVLSLDELPQLWNILCGDMSLVGPRPALPKEIQQYAPWQRRRLRMRPGLTCLWALEGRSQLRFENWVKLDLLYIERWSIWLDCKILFKTIPAVLSGKGAH